MPHPFKELTADQIEALLEALEFTRTINEVHIHHTWRPNHSQDRGLDSVEGIYRYHTEKKGWSDIGQHLTIDSTGRIWSGRSWNRVPASAKGHNQGVFSIEIIGDFDAGNDRFKSQQKAVTETVTGLILERFSLQPINIRFHREFSSKSCPGSSISQIIFRNSVNRLLQTSRPKALLESLSPGEQIEIDALIKLFQLDQGLPDDPVEAEPDHFGIEQLLIFDRWKTQKPEALSTLTVDEKKAEGAPEKGLLEDKPPILELESDSSAPIPDGGIDDETCQESDTEPTELELTYDRALDSVDEKTFSSMECSNGSVFWPNIDSESPEYAHLTNITADTEFEVTAADVETLVAANRFRPEGHQNTIVLGIRGSVLRSGYEAEYQEAIPLIDIRPNHVDFRCTLGFYFRDAGNLTLFTGSTVPATFYVQDYYNIQNDQPFSKGEKCNLMPSGCYVSRVDRHGTAEKRIYPAVRTSNPGNLAKDGAVTVLRTTNDLSYTIQDEWDSGIVYDNIHCSYILHCSPKYGARFSSAGCSTVRGRKDPSDQWAKFQAVLNTLGQGKRIDYLLLTGREYAITAHLRQSGHIEDPVIVQQELGRLRVGSFSDEVVKLQRKLGFRRTGYFGRSTKKRLTEFQRDNGLRPDGIYSPALDQLLKWDVFD